MASNDNSGLIISLTFTGSLFVTIILALLTFVCFILYSTQRLGFFGVKLATLFGVQNYAGSEEKLVENSTNYKRAWIAYWCFWGNICINVCNIISCCLITCCLPCALPLVLLTSPFTFGLVLFMAFLFVTIFLIIGCVFLVLLTFFDWYPIYLLLKAYGNSTDMECERYSEKHWAKYIRKEKRRVLKTNGKFHIVCSHRERRTRSYRSGGRSRRRTYYVTVTTYTGDQELRVLEWGDQTEDELDRSNRDWIFVKPKSSVRHGNEIDIDELRNRVYEQNKRRDDKCTVWYHPPAYESKTKQAVLVVGEKGSTEDSDDSDEDCGIDILPPSARLVIEGPKSNLFTRIIYYLLCYNIFKAKLLDGEGVKQSQEFVKVVKAAELTDLDGRKYRVGKNVENPEEESKDDEEEEESSGEEMEIRNDNASKDFQDFNTPDRLLEQQQQQEKEQKEPLQFLPPLVGDMEPNAPPMEEVLEQQQQSESEDEKKESATEEEESDG